MIERYKEQWAQYKDFLTTSVGRDFFVVLEIYYDMTIWKGDTGDGWLEYLTLFQKGDLKGAQAQGERESTPSYSPHSPSHDHYSAAVSSPTSDAPRSPTPSSPAATTPAAAAPAAVDAAEGASGGAPMGGDSDAESDDDAAGAKSPDTATSRKRPSEQSARSAETLDLSLRNIKIRKAQPTTLSKLAVAVVKLKTDVETVAVVQPNTDVEAVAGADGQAARRTPRAIKSMLQRANLYRGASYWKAYKRKIRSVAWRVSELLYLTKDDLEKKLKRMDVLYAVMCMYFHDCFRDPVYKKYLEDNFIESSVRCEFMLLDLMGGATNTKNGGDETLHWINIEEWETFLKQYEEIKPSEQRTIDRINDAVEKRIEAEKKIEVRKIQIQGHNEEARGGQEDTTFGGGKRSRTLLPNKEESMRQLYHKVHYSQWFDFQKHITTLSAYVTTQLNAIDQHGEDRKLKENKPLYVVYNYLSALMDRMSEEDSSEDMHAQVQIESYVMDAMNNDVDAIKNETPGFEDCVALDAWKIFLQTIPENVTDIDALKKLTLRSELVITDASADLTIHGLTRRLEELLDW